MIKLLGLTPLFPFLGFIFLTLTGGKLAKPAIAWIGAGTVGISAVLSALIGTEFLSGGMETYRLTIGSWMAVDDFTVPFGFYLDALSLTMLFIVTGVGLLIHIYSVQFMGSDAGYARFFAYMNLFVSAMLVLILADNFVLLYLGWEGVGLGSYLLIGFWYEDANNGYAARKAFIMTRVGDTALAIGLFLLFTQMHTLDIQAVMQKVSGQWEKGSVLPVAAAALLLGGAVGKSAQLPLQTWLPDAMAGPTPVSALIHAATMVTAGVYLIARTHDLFMLAPAVQFTVALIGAATLLLAGFSALVQTDIKRILAYSTISQIGYMFLALGAGAWSAAVFHLLTHAFFKALLFLAAGAVIFCFHHEHNIFKMGGLRKALPVPFWSFMIGSAALSGLPFTSGYYSKHQILLSVFEVNPGLWAAACFGALITGLYSFRLVFVAFFGPEGGKTEKSVGWLMNGPLLSLCVLALIGGMLRIPLDSVFPVLNENPGHHGIDMAGFLTIASPIAGVLIAALFYLTGAVSYRQLSSIKWIGTLHRFWFSGWGFDWLYNRLLVCPFKYLAKVNKNDVIDSGFTAIAAISRGLHSIASASQTGRIRWYAASMGLGSIVIIAIGLLS